MALTRKQSALVHVAKKQLALSDADYRAILMHAAGVGSSRDLDGEGFEAVLTRFLALGFTPSAKPPTYGERWGMASPGQVAHIRSLWEEYTDGEGNDRSLGKWLFRIAKVSDLRFLTVTGARKAIAGLRAMVERKRATLHAE